jgi:acetylornithine deacetylase/succinyl-diaminopimelate desuccinylase-like protein
VPAAPTDIPALLADSRVAAARRTIEQWDAATLALQAELSAIPAPGGAEAARAARVAGLLREQGLTTETDAVGNVVARGTGEGPPVIVAAHLDTVFDGAVDVAVRRTDQRLDGPGVSDNARGLAALVGLAAALREAGLATVRPLLFVATVGEEGRGDLRGAKHLLGGTTAGAFIALDGAGLERVVHRGVGSRRYRVTYRGPGGHSWSAFGVPNPASAVARAATALDELAATLPQQPRTTLAVVGLGGGTSLNSIPATAWLDIDLRSESADALPRLDQNVHKVLTTAMNAENGRRLRGTARLRMDVTRLGNRPAGATPADAPIVHAALAATRALGVEPELAAASTDANAAMALGIPAIALGAGGRAGGVHTPAEWYENDQGALGIVRALLVLLAAAEPV